MMTSILPLAPNHIRDWMASDSSLHSIDDDIPLAPVANSPPHWTVAELLIRSEVEVSQMSKYMK